MAWLQLLGWAGSVVLVWSLLQARVLRLRVLNLVASLMLLVFNAAIGVWPMVAMNAAIAAIDAWHIVALLRTRHDGRTYQVVEVGPNEEYLRYVLRRHDSDIRRYNPELVWDGAAAGALAFLVLRDDETVGVVLLRDEGDGAARVALDYVTPRFRDFTPGEFVYGRSGLFRAHGFTRVLAPRRMREGEAYLARVGFRPEGTEQVLAL